MKNTINKTGKLRDSDWCRGQLPNLVSVTAIALTCLFASGCASIVDGGPRNVRIDSNPSGVKFTVYDKAGTVIESKATPATIALRGDESFFKGEDYRVAFEAPGYCPADVRIKSEVNGWFYGNIFFGGLVGMVIDGASGAMWTLSPTDIKYDLVPALAAHGAEASNTALLKPDPPTEVKFTKIKTSNGGKQ